MQDSLAGNSKTTLIVALSPHVSNHEETVATLQFAERCKLLKNKVLKSKIRSTAELSALVDTLTKELAELKGEFANVSSLIGFAVYNKSLENSLKGAGVVVPDRSAAGGEDGEDSDEDTGASSIELAELRVSC